VAGRKRRRDQHRQHRNQRSLHGCLLMRDTSRVPLSSKDNGQTGRFRGLWVHSRQIHVFLLRRKCGGSTAVATAIIRSRPGIGGWLDVPRFSIWPPLEEVPDAKAVDLGRASRRDGPSCLRAIWPPFRGNQQQACVRSRADAPARPQPGGRSWARTSRTATAARSGRGLPRPHVRILVQGRDRILDRRG
jgi:hypothetical protein